MKDDKAGWKGWDYSKARILEEWEEREVMPLLESIHLQGIQLCLKKKRGAFLVVREWETHLENIKRQEKGEKAG